MKPHEMTNEELQMAVAAARELPWFKWKNWPTDLNDAVELWKEMGAADYHFLLYYDTDTTKFCFEPGMGQRYTDTEPARCICIAWLMWKAATP